MGLICKRQRIYQNKNSIAVELQKIKKAAIAAF